MRSAATKGTTKSGSLHGDGAPCVSVYVVDMSKYLKDPVRACPLPSIAWPLAMTAQPPSTMPFPALSVSTGHGGVSTTFQSCQNLAVGAFSVAVRL